MPTDQPSPWARGATPTTGEAVPVGPVGPVGPSGPPSPTTYDGPWRPTPQPWTADPGWPAQQPWASPPGPPEPGWPVPPTWAGPVSDDQLRQLPPPVPRPLVEQRPAVVGLAVTLAVTGSLLWVCGLSLFLLVAAAGTQALGPAGEDGVLFHLLDDVLLRMGDGLWVPLYGFPVASVVTGFCLLARRRWTQVAHTAVGVAALGWAAWWLQESLLTWVVVAVYVGVAVGVLWVPSARRWYGRPSERQSVEPGVRLNG